MLGAGSHNRCGFNWDNGSIAVSNKSGEASVNWDSSVGSVVVGVRESSTGIGDGSNTSISYGSVGVVANLSGMDSSTSSSVGNLGSIDFRGVLGDNSSVKVSNKSSVSIAKMSSVSQTSVASWVNGSTSSSMGSLSSLNLQGVNWNNGAVVVAHKLGRGDSHAGSENLEHRNGEDQLNSKESG